MKKKIIVIDDEPLISTLMKEIIEGEKDLEIAEIATQKEDFLNLLKQSDFDAALIDISVGGREEGLNLLEAVKTQGLPAIVISAHDEVDYAYKCLAAGARGYLNKNCIFSDLVPALKMVLAGQLFVSGPHGPYILSEYSKTQKVEKSQ